MMNFTDTPGDTLLRQRDSYARIIAREVTSGSWPDQYILDAFRATEAEVKRRYPGAS